MPAGRLPIPIEIRFWRKVDRRSPDECWNWIGAEHGYGYGGISVQGKSVPAHRVSYALAYGPLPPDKFVLHRCDNPRCVNPSHLWLGSHNDNMADMVAKGRSTGRPGSQRLTPEQAMAARMLYEQAGLTTKRIAQRMNVPTSLIRRAVNWQTHKHIGATPKL